ncbi:MAG: SDR family oxidoreductase [Proteobacteria bacterium]|nr:SDR family oxidoreductase [Pseudomonadota bacterium]
MPERAAPLAGRVVVITGGAGGIGRALADAFGARGARIALLDRDEAGLQEAASEREGRPLTVVCDVTDPEDCEAAMARVIEALGAIDVLVNNAGISHRSRFADTDLSVLRRVIEVNLFGSMYCTAAALPSLRQQKGRIVAISSVAGFAPLVGRTGYSASKHALHGFFDTLRAELRGSGVSVTLACPYFVDTPLRTHALDGRGETLSAAPVSMARPLSPEAVADAIVCGCIARRRAVVPGVMGQASWWISRLAPGLYERLMLRSQRGES